MDVKRTILLGPALVAVFALGPVAISEASADIVSSAAVQPAKPKPCFKVAACKEGFSAGYAEGMKCGKNAFHTRRSAQGNFTIGFNMGHDAAASKFCGEDEVEEE
jgi:hypothetical protein